VGFLSVSLSAGSRNADVDAARALPVSFVRSAEWEPRHVVCFAEKLAYTLYGFVKRVVMQFIAWREGAPTDARRDYEFADWKALRQFALDVSQDVRRACELEASVAV
jgi:menaquinone-dependent protoporphyrinogen oxidase